MIFFSSSSSPAQMCVDAGRLFVCRVLVTPVCLHTRMCDRERESVTLCFFHSCFTCCPGNPKTPPCHAIGSALPNELPAASSASQSRNGTDNVTVCVLSSCRLHRCRCLSCTWSCLHACGPTVPPSCSVCSDVCCVCWWIHVDVLGFYVSSSLKMLFTLNNSSRKESSCSSCPPAEIFHPSNTNI